MILIGGRRIFWVTESEPAGMAAYSRMGNRDLICRHTESREQQEWGEATQSLSLSDIFPAARFHIHKLPKQHHHPGTKCSSAWTSRGHFLFKASYFVHRDKQLRVRSSCSVGQRDYRLCLQDATSSRVCSCLCKDLATLSLQFTFSDRCRVCGREFVRAGKMAQ